MAYAACERAAPTGWDEGSVGAGTGCTVGKLYGPRHAMKGGIGVGYAGVAVERSAGNADRVVPSACAIAVVNAVGHVRGPGGEIIAGPREPGGGIADSEATGYVRGFFAPPEANTTIAVVALNRAYSKVELHRIARAASAAYARRIGPSGTQYDGDVVFAVCPLDAPGGDTMRAELVATAALEDAIVRAVRAAKGRDGIPGLADA
jgi:L-aminopeptidase/D-esterase-like protein